MGVSPESAEDASVAIYPITVLSPVLNTIPVPDPLVHAVPKKATFPLSNMFFYLLSGFLSNSSDSPVNDALLTFISLLCIIIISAGMLSPINCKCTIIYSVLKRCHRNFIEHPKKILRNMFAIVTETIPTLAEEAVDPKALSNSKEFKCNLY